MSELFCDLFDFHEMAYPGNHTAYLRCVVLYYEMIRASQSERFDRAFLIFDPSDGAACLCDLDLCHIVIVLISAVAYG